MKKKIIAAFLLILTLALCGCGQEQEEAQTVNTEDMFTERDLDASYDESSSTKIQLNGDSASCDSDSVQISGSQVTIKDEGTYILSGSLDDGMIIVDAEDSDKPQLVFDNVTVNSETSAPLYILKADKVFVTMTEGSENTLSNGGTFTAIDDNNIDGAVFSKQDLTFNGNGTLTVTSPSGHGIVCKDDLVFTSGSYTVNSASHGLDANDSVRAAASTLSIDSGKDGIHAENSDDTSLGFVYIKDGTFKVEAEGDGIDAGYYAQIEDGKFTVTSGGGSENASKESSDSWGGFMGGDPGNPMMHQQQETTDSSDDESSTSIKGIKTTGDLIINSGTFKLNTADDALHSNASMTINDGTFEIAAGDDAIHAEETLKVVAGTINISESYEGLEALHINVSGGDISLKASDDGFNAAGGTDASGEGGRDQMGGGPGGDPGSSSSDGTIEISGGNITIHASGDGIDANGSLLISGGKTIVSGPTQGDTAVLDYDTTAEITGGTFIGTGAISMAQTFSDSEQGVIAVNAGNQTSGTDITLKDSSGTEVMSYTTDDNCSLIILSSPDIVKGDTYTITVGSASGEFTAE